MSHAGDCIFHRQNLLGTVSMNIIQVWCVVREMIFNGVRMLRCGRVVHTNISTVCIAHTPTGMPMLR